MFAYFKTHGRMITLGLVLTLLLVWTHLTGSGWVRSAVDRLNFLTYDLRLQATHMPVSPADLDVVVIDIDERSLAAHGRWPWSRLVIADLVVRLHQFGAAVVGFDISFPEAERNAALEVLSSQHSESAAPAQRAWLESLAPQLDRDALLASVLPGRNVVLGVLFSSDGAELAGQLPPPWFFLKPEQAATHQVLDMPGYSANLPALQATATYGGFLNATSDDDGVMRRTPLVMRHGELVYPSLALAMARVYRDAVRFRLNSAPVQEQHHATGIELDELHIPTDRYGRVLIRYFGGEGTFPYVSAADVLSATSLDALPQLNGKAVIVGTSALGLYDLRNTPLQPAFPGVEAQASLLQTLISDELAFPVEPDWDDMLVLLFLVALGVVLSLLAPGMSALALGLSALGLMAGLVLGNVWLWEARGVSVSPVLPVLLVLVIAVANMVRGFFNESQRRQELHGMFGQYVPPAHINRMLASDDAGSFEGETREMSVLFADIRSFTTISEGLDAVQLKTMLNEFFTPVTQVIFDSGGTIDKYIGDLVMAFWGAPLDDPEHRSHAIGAALDMLKTVDEIRPQLVAAGYPEIHIGIGVNSGPMSVGDMGSSYRRAYTVLGDAVNLGSRLEGLTKYYGVSLLVGEESRRADDGFLYRFIDKVQVKGKGRSVRIYEPICRFEEATLEQRDLLEQHAEAMRLYMMGMLQEARVAFEALQTRAPDVQQSLMLERIDELAGAGLSAEWTGTFKHETK